MKEKYAFLKFRPHSTRTYIYKCDDSIEKGNIVLVNTSTESAPQEALVDRVDFLEEDELPIAKEDIKSVCKIISQNADNSKFCENAQLRYKIDLPDNIARNWIEQRQYLDCPYDVIIITHTSGAKIIVNCDYNFGVIAISVPARNGNSAVEHEIYTSENYELNYVLTKLKINIHNYIVTPTKSNYQKLREYLLKPNDIPNHYK